MLLARWLDDKRISELEGQRALSVIVLLASLCWFVIFYPNSTAVAVHQGFADLVYFAIPGWKY